jgi:hypothetical protein
VEAADLETDQVRAELSVLVFDAMRRVAEEPRHAASEFVSSSKQKPSDA